VDISKWFCPELAQEKNAPDQKSSAFFFGAVRFLKK
jgi:hypothetical protein